MRMLVIGSVLLAFASGCGSSDAPPEPLGARGQKVLPSPKQLDTPPSDVRTDLEHDDGVQGTVRTDLEHDPEAEGKAFTDLEHDSTQGQPIDESNGGKISDDNGGDPTTDGSGSEFDGSGSEFDGSDSDFGGDDFGGDDFGGFGDDGGFGGFGDIFGGSGGGSVAPDPCPGAFGAGAYLCADDACCAPTPVPLACASGGGTACTVTGWPACCF